MPNASQSTSDFKGDHLSVKMFGAVGNGTTDDTAAIQAGIDAVISAGGGELFFPAGEYLITQLTVTSPNVYLRGAGEKSSKLRSAITSGSVICWDSSALSGSQDGGGISDMMIYGTQSVSPVPSTTEIGIEIKGTASAEWYNLAIRNVAVHWLSNGVKIDYNVGLHFDNCTITCVAAATGVALDLHHGHERFFTNLTTFNPTSYDALASIRINDGSIGDYFMNASLMNAIDGVLINGGIWGTFTNLLSDGMTANGVKIAPSLGLSSTSWRFCNTWISTCPVGFRIDGTAATVSVINVIGGTVTASDDGFIVTNASDVAISGISMLVGNYYGVDADNAPGLMVSSNVIDGGVYGIRVQGTTTLSGTPSNVIRNFATGYVLFGSGTRDYTFERSTDEQIASFLMSANAGGSANVVEIRDNRGYSGVNTGTALFVESWSYGLGSGGALVDFRTNAGGVPVSRLLIDNNTGDLTTSGRWCLANDKEISWLDSGGVPIRSLYMDGSDNFNIGAQSVVTTPFHGVLSLFANGEKMLNLFSVGTNQGSLEPIAAFAVDLGDSLLPFLNIYARGARFDSGIGAGAYLSLQSGTSTEVKYVSIYGPATFGAGDTYYIYLPPAQGAAGSTLLNDGAGALSWSTNGALPVSDATAIVKGSSDATKFLRFEVDGFTASTTRVITPPDADITIAGQNFANVFSAEQTIVNDTRLKWKDSGGTARQVVYFDGSNDLHVGINDITGLPAGYGKLRLYAYGINLLNLTGNGTAKLVPETDDTVWLGDDTHRFSVVHAVRLTAQTIGLTHGNVLIESGNGGYFASIYGASTGTATYSMYLPPAQGGAGTTLVNDGSGVLTWASAALPAGTSAQTLRHNGTAWIASGTLTNDGAVVGLFSSGAINGPILNIRSDFTAAGKHAMIRFGDQSQTADYQKGALIYEGVTASARGRFHIALENTDGATSVALSDARLTVNSNGNVGIGTTDDDGTPATGRLVVKGSTNDGTTNILVGRDSSEANVFSVNTDGLTTVGGFKLATGAGAGKVLTSDAAGVGTWGASAALPEIVANIARPTESAAIGSTNLLGSAPAGLYRMTYYIHVTTSGAAGTLSFSGGWTYNGAYKVNGNAMADTGLGDGYVTESFTFESDASNITYAVALSGGAGVAYSVFVSLERLN